MNGVHEPGELSAHALGLLGGAQARAVEQHLAGCAACRREWSELRGTAAVLDQVPPEMFLDGPPDADLMLQRTLRQVRTEAGSQRNRRRFVRATAAVAVVAALLGVGAVVGRTSAPAADPAPIAAPADVATVEGTAGPVAMTAAVTPVSGWVRVAATVRGIPAGEACTLAVIAKDGSEHEVSSWLVSARGEADGTQLQGSTIVRPEDVLAVTVHNDRGTDFITLKV